jgi:hypothetical protein
MRPTLSLSLSLLFVLLAACTPSTPAFTLDASAPGNADAAAALSDDDAEPLGVDGGSAGDPSWEAGVPTGNDAGAGSIDLPVEDASTGPPAVDAGPDTDACNRPVGAGDLVVDELMIESVAGTGDYGEWLEVTNVAACAVNLQGLHGECPVGAKVYSFDVSGDVWIPPLGTFVVADSADPAVNHYLPGMVFTWQGQPDDVLRNEGGTVTLTFGETLVASLTWPSLKLSPGVSVELPADCAVADAADFGAWLPAQWSWFPGFRGTPNAPNTDVSCPE